MRDALNNLVSNQITLEDSSQFYYTISPYELTNSLGNIIAVLQEYNFADPAGLMDSFQVNYTRQKKVIGMTLKM